MDAVVLVFVGRYSFRIAFLACTANGQEQRRFDCWRFGRLIHSSNTPFPIHPNPISLIKSLINWFLFKIVLQVIHHPFFELPEPIQAHLRKPEIFIRLQLRDPLNPYYFNVFSQLHQLVPRVL